MTHYEKITYEKYRMIAISIATVLIFFVNPLVALGMFVSNVLSATFLSDLLSAHKDSENHPSNMAHKVKTLGFPISFTILLSLATVATAFLVGPGTAFIVFLIGTCIEFPLIAQVDKFLNRIPTDKSVPPIIASAAATQPTQILKPEVQQPPKKSQAAQPVIIAIPPKNGKTLEARQAEADARWETKRVAQYALSGK